MTLILSRAAAGDEAAGRQLLPLVYDELRALASRYLDRNRAGHTLEPTALVHEAYLRLVGPDAGGGDAGPGERPALAAGAGAGAATRAAAESSRRFADRAHFMAAAALAMRSVLVDHARRRGAEKRGGAACRVALDGPAGAGVADHRRDLEILELDDLLQRLAQLDPRRSRVVELKFFAGMTNDEVAQVVGVSRSTVADDWAVARSWIAARLTAR